MRGNMPPMHSIEGKRVVVMGLGRFGGGVGAARFCVRQGARHVLVTDLLGEEELTESLAKLEGEPIDFRLGEHRETDFAMADLVIVNPAVDRRLNRYLHAAERASVDLTTEIELLIERLPSREHTIGITGTAGKSTVTAMIGQAMTSHYGEGRVHVGGNIGGSLLGEIERIQPDDWVVLELSSFMLEAVGDWSPHIAVVTNVGDNHLDRHHDIDAYVRAKKTILRHQRPSDFAVLGGGVADWRFDTPAACVVIDEPLRTKLHVVGEHNGLNAAMAVAACEHAGMAREAAIAAVGEFPGLPHRLQHVAEHAGRIFYNDSKSTTPEAACLAIDSFPPRTVHAILGGYDKKAGLKPLAEYAAHKCAAIYTIGQTGDAIAKAAENVLDGCVVHRSGTLSVAVREAVTSAQPGQVVLLSPACASWDQFDNYEQRGSAFAEFVLRYTTETGFSTPLDDDRPSSPTGGGT